MPRIVFCNKMDKPGASYWLSAESARTKLAARVLPIQLPIGLGDEFKGVIDVVKMKAMYWLADDRGVG